MSSELERNADNAAFYDLGFRWHWDDETYAGLLRYSPKPEARIRHYLETYQPHLLKAYDAQFLTGVIQERMVQHKDCSRVFNWAQAAECELGV